VPSSPLMEGLHTRLAPDADDAGILDVAYRTLDTPAGPALVTTTGGWLGLSLPQGWAGNGAFEGQGRGTRAPRPAAAGHRIEGAIKKDLEVLSLVLLPSGQVTWPTWRNRRARRVAPG
jgi:hypothetical protein